MPPYARFRSVRTLLLAVVPLLGLLAAPSGAADPVDVYPLGDSITLGTTMHVESGGGFTRVMTPGGYRADLLELLAAAGLPHQFRGTRADNTAPNQDAAGQTQHDGWSGARIDEVATALDGPGPDGSPGHWLTGGGHWEFDVDVVIVHLGTNDIAQRWDPGTSYPTADGRADLSDPAQRAVFVRHLADRLAGLVGKLRTLRPRARIVLSAVAPFATSNGTGPTDPVTPEYAHAVGELVAAERAAGGKVVLADVFGAFVTPGPGGPAVTPGLLSPDNAHPVKNGYSVMAKVFHDAVLAALAL